MNTINNFNVFGLTRNLNNELVPEQLPELIQNTGQIQQNTNYVVSRDGGNNLVAIEEAERVNDLDQILDDRRYHLTRENDRTIPVEDESIQIPSPTTGNLIYGVRRENKNFNLTRVPNFIEYAFRSNNLQTNANFNILGTLGSRCVHVINARCKIIKIGIVHVSTFRSIGVIDRDYSFEFIINNINEPQFTVTFPGGAVRRSITQDIEDLNYFLNPGDCFGIRYVPTTNAATGNYCEVRVSCDTNAREDDFENELIP